MNTIQQELNDLLIKCQTSDTLKGKAIYNEIDKIILRIPNQNTLFLHYDSLSKIILHFKDIKRDRSLEETVQGHITTTNPKIVPTEWLVNSRENFKKKKTQIDEELKANIVKPKFHTTFTKGLYLHCLDNINKLNYEIAQREDSLAQLAKLL